MSAVAVMILLPMLTIISQSIGIDMIGAAQAASDCSLSGDDSAPAWGSTVDKDELTGGGFRNSDDRYEFGDMDEGDWDEGGKDMNRLIHSFHTSFVIGNDSAVSLRMNMTTGYKYTFCINLQPVIGEANQQEPTGDVYLLQEYDYERYAFDFDSRNNEFGGFRSDIQHSPPVIQNILFWHPFRDVHAYEKIDNVDFSVALDHDETSSTWDPFSDKPPQHRSMYLIIDGWDNIRDYDSEEINRNMTADVTVVVEERFALPNWTVAVICCGSLLAILAAPFLVHHRYMKAGMPENVTGDLMPHLETEAERDSLPSMKSVD
ncbi:MAG: hypothetical protein QF440_07100 [Candidatus Thalassarchaeaceae archaeon]|nr:hypothetical protein [Candidatus Thalassarchaeaceae archaeon]